MKNLLFIIFTICFALLFSDVINVPEDFLTIQQALNSASENDTIFVENGVYYENLLWPSVNGIKLTGASTDDCIIDGNSSGSVIRFYQINGIVDTTTVISGFTIMNGSAGGGGGINSYSASPKLMDLKIISNNATSDGGGLFCFNYSHFVLQKVIISNNHAASEGGGINCDFSSNLKIRNCEFRNNSAYIGGALCIEGGSNPDIYYTLFTNNTADYGGAIWSGEKGSCDLINCTIANNSATIQGGGYHSYYNSLDVLNCIFWNNIPDQIFQDAYVTYSDIQDGWNGIGNIDNDPLFEDAVNGNFKLTSDSPCIDAGDPSSQLDPDETIADMGCFYFDQLAGINNQISSTDYLLSNFPNPFNPSTTISFSVTQKAMSGSDGSDFATIEIYNIKGQKVKTFSNLQNSKSLNQQIVWNGSDLNNKPVSSGIYFYQLKVDGKAQLCKKMILLK